MRRLFEFSIFSIFLSIGFLSCQKGDTAPGCTLGNYGTVTVSNTSENPYDFYVDDQYKTTVRGNSITDKIHIPAGDGHKLFVKQLSGYVISPTEETKILDVQKCNDYDWQIP
jgi:hypothetical protein